MTQSWQLLLFLYCFVVRGKLILAKQNKIEVKDPSINTWGISTDG